MPSPRDQGRTGLERLHSIVFLHSLPPPPPHSHCASVMCSMICTCLTPLPAQEGGPESRPTPRAGLPRAGVGCGLVGRAPGCGGWFRTPGIYVPLESGQGNRGSETSHPKKQRGLPTGGHERPPEQGSSGRGSGVGGGLGQLRTTWPLITSTGHHEWVGTSAWIRGRVTGSY